MPGPRRRAPISMITLWLATGLGCGGGSDSPADTGPDPADAGSPPIEPIEDAGFFDGGTREVGDAGFADPATLLLGREQVGAVRTYMQIRGTTTSTHPPVVFINTGPMHSFEYLVEPFDFLLGPGGAEEPDRLLVFYDMRGTGDSNFGDVGNATVSFENHVADLDALIGFVNGFAGQFGPVDLVGHGYGAGVGAIYAADFPERVGRLVLITPHAATALQQAQFMAEWNARMSTTDRERLSVVTDFQYCLRDFGRCSREVWALMGPHFLCPENRSLFGTMPFRFVEIRPFFFSVLPQLRDQEYDWRDDFARVRAPTTVVAGPCDPQPPEAAQTYTASIAGARSATVPGSGHFPMVENPLEFQAIIRRAFAE